MFYYILQVSPPTTITVDTLVIAKVSAAFIGLSGVCWGVKHLIRLLQRS